MGHFYADLCPIATMILLTFFTMMKCCNEIKVRIFNVFKRSITGPKLGYLYSNLSKRLFIFLESYSKEFPKILQE